VVQMLRELPFALHRQQPDKDQKNVDLSPPPGKIYVDTHANEIIRAIPLSNDSVQRRADEMAENTEETLCNMLTITEFGFR